MNDLRWRTGREEGEVQGSERQDRNGAARQRSDTTARRYCSVSEDSCENDGNSLARWSPFKLNRDSVRSESRVQCESDTTSASERTGTFGSPIRVRSVS